MIHSASERSQSERAALADPTQAVPAYDALTQSGTRIAARIRAGEITSSAVLEAHARWIEARNPELNAIVELRLDAARREARAADTAIREGRTDLPRFHGVPCTIKESFELEGMPLTAGLVARRGTRSRRNGPTVERMLRAGAIPLGSTNVSELLMWLESSNAVYGRSNNPYDPTRIVGGSSGGEGASVGASFAPFGLGADVAGSIRFPAFFNGVFGHKPTAALVPNAGQWPLAHGDALRYLCTGPIARRAEDLWPLLQELAGPHAESPECLAHELGDPSSVSLEGLTVLDVEHNGIRRPSRELAMAQRRVADHLEARGARVTRVLTLPGLSRSLHYWSAMLSAAGGEEFGVMLGNGRRKPFLPELLRLLTGQSEHTLPALALAALEQIPKLLPGDTDALVRAGRALKVELADRIGDGVMLYPTYTRPAPRHGVPLLLPLDFAYTAIINVMELPSTQVPLGLGTAGVPLGCQVIGRHGNDHVTVAVAQELERAFGGWVPPAALTSWLAKRSPIRR